MCSEGPSYTYKSTQLALWSVLPVGVLPSPTARYSTSALWYVTQTTKNMCDTRLPGFPEGGLHVWGWCTAPCIPAPPNCCGCKSPDIAGKHIEWVHHFQYITKWSSDVFPPIIIVPPENLIIFYSPQDCLLLHVHLIKPLQTDTLNLLYPFIFSFWCPLNLRGWFFL